jgi:hypothetical protein
MLADLSARDHGQGQNRTADTMIFSHVLYQLSYLAQTKNPPEPPRRGREELAIGRSYRLLAPARLSGLHVSATVQRTGFFNPISSELPNVGKRRPRATLHEP